MVKVFISDHKLVPHHTVNGLTEVGRWITILSLQIFILQVFWKKLGGVVPMQLLCKLAQRNNCLGFLCFQREELRLSEPKSREYLALNELVFASGVWQHGVLDAKPSDVFPGVHGAGQLGGGWEASLHCSAQLELPCLGSLWSLSRKESLEMQQVFQHTANQLVNLWFSYRQVETKFSFLLIYPHVPVYSCFSWKCCALEVILHKPWLGRSELSNCNLSPFSLFLYGETIFVRIRSVKFFFCQLFIKLNFFFPKCFPTGIVKQRCLLWTDTSPWVWCLLRSRRASRALKVLTGNVAPASCLRRAGAQLKLPHS